MKNAAELPFLVGRSLFLRPLGPADASDDYLSWLNDPEVLRWRGPKAFPTTRRQLKAIIGSLPDRGDLVLAIRTLDGKRHVGNISLNTISWVHGHAELAIMIGAKDIWGRGVGRESIELLTGHAFAAMGLNRVWAESPNPAFNKVMQKLRWTREGVKRRAFWVDGRHVDVQCWGVLASEWRRRAKANR